MAVGIETPGGFEPEPEEQRERAERRHPATVTAERLRAHRTDYQMDLTPREQDTLELAIRALDRIAGLNA